MSDLYSSFVKFTYTIVDPKGIPEQKCYLLNLNFIVNIESGNNNDIKIYMSNNKIIDIELGRDYNASKLMVLVFTTIDSYQTRLYIFLIGFGTDFGD